MSNFQIVVISLFVMLALVGLLIFSGILPGFRAPQGGAGGSITWWGTVPAEPLEQFLADFNRAHRAEFTLNYVYQSPVQLEQALVEALARGEGPDLVTFPHELIIRHGDKIQPLPYEVFSEREFNDRFVDGTSLFLTPEGSIGLPLAVDPLVLYYNRDLFNTAGVAAPPASWRALEAANRILTRTDLQSNIQQAGIALGHFGNIVHAKDVLSLLLLQAGTPIVTRAGGSYRTTLDDTLGLPRAPAAEALEFWTRFTDPANSLYAWSAALPEARESFARGELAMYLGFASEQPRLAAQNPQLNFDVALVPQREGGPAVGFGRFGALAVLRQSQNQSTAFQVAYTLALGGETAAWAAAAGAVPARVDLIQNPPADAAAEVFYRAALAARGWLDPSPVATGEIFRRLAEAVQVGMQNVATALSTADAQLAQLLPQQEQ